MMSSHGSQLRGYLLITVVMLAAFCAQTALAIFNMTITKTASNPTPAPGDQVDYTITAFNGGPDQASILVVNDLIPPGLQYVTNTVSSGIYVPSSGDWTVFTPMPAASGVSLTISTIVDLPYTLVSEVPNPTGTSSDWFGFDVDGVGSDKLISGCYKNDPFFLNNAGVAHLCRLDGSLILSVTNPVPVEQDFFGYAVAGIGDSVFAVAAHRQQQGAFLEAGNVYVYNTSGALIATINNPDPNTYDHFGRSLDSLNDEFLLIGAFQDDIGADDAGAAYLYDTNGSQICIFTNPTPRTGDQFGYDVAGLGTDKIIIGAPGDNPSGVTGAGSVYVFNTNGVLLRTINNPAPATDDFFGWSVAGVGFDRILTGAYSVDAPGEIGAGAAFLHNINGSLLATIPNPDPLSSDWFGYSVECVGRGVLLIGAWRDHPNGISDAGSAYLYSTNSSLLATVTNEAPSSYDYYGHGLASFGPDKFAVTAYREDKAGSDSGNIYIFSMAGAAAPVNRAFISSVTPDDDSYANDDSDTAILQVTNQTPVASDDYIVTPEDTPLVLQVLTNDLDADTFDTLWVTNITGSVNGSMSIAWSGHGITFTPELNWYGTNNIGYTVCDNRGLSDTASVTIVVTPVNDIPVITNQIAGLATTNQIFEVMFEHLLVFDPDNVYTDDFTFAVYNGASYTLTNNTVYHDPAFTGTLNVPVTVNDGMGDSEQYILKVAAAHWLSVTNAVNGSVPALNGWYPHGTNATISATGIGAFCFFEWTGDIPAEQARQNPAEVFMDQPRNIVATFVSDTDADLVPDSWENTNVGNLGEDASSNTDGDRFTLDQEYSMGLDPTKLDIGLPVEGVEVSWISVPGSNYQLRACANLATSSWYNVGSSAAGTGAEMAGFDTAEDRAYMVYSVVGSPVTLKVWRADAVLWQAGSGTNYQLQWSDTWFLGSWSASGSQIPGAGDTNAAYMSNRAKADRYYRLDTP